MSNANHLFTTNIWYDVFDVWRQELLQLIEMNDWNQRLKDPLRENSPIPIFHYWKCVHWYERCYLVAVSRFFHKQIMGILTYTSEPKHQKMHLISIGTCIKWRWIGTLLIDTLLSKTRWNIATLCTEIHPDDPDYETRWTDFLIRKTQEYWINLEIMPS